MAGTDSPTSSGQASISTPSVDSFLEAKLHPPTTRNDWVHRSRLLDRLDRVMERPVLLLAAPAGFGKTTLVAQWLESRRPKRAGSVWLSLDAGDNDPVRLLSHLATALERAGLVLGHDVTTFMVDNSGDVTAGLLPRLLKAMEAMPEDIVILLDDFHCVQSTACHDQIQYLIEHLPPRAHLLITTRADPGLRLGRLRAAGHLAEVRTADLAFNEAEAAVLLANSDVELSRDAMAQLMHRTEGWPAALYLAALSLSGRADVDEFVAHFSGGNRFVADYLTEEVLSRHTDEVREFITTTSILDRLSASLCDFVSESNGSSALLHELERTNLLLVPLDENREWFRFHHLFASVARSELEIEHPDRVPLLHARAATWFSEHGNIDDAIGHMLASGRPSDAAVLVQANWLTYVSAGRGATVSGWLDALGTSSVSSEPSAAVTAAWMDAMSGDEEGLSRRVEVIRNFPDSGPLPDGTRSVESAIAMIHGLFGYGGPVEMSAGARRAVELETDGRSPYYALANTALGHAAYVAGDLEAARGLLAKASDNEAAPPVIQVLALSCQSLVEAERGQQDRSRVLAELAMEILESNSLQSMPQATMAWTALGQAQAAAGKLTDAMESVEQGLALRRRNPSQGPWGTLHHLLVSARVAIACGELQMAQELIDESSRRMDRFTDGMRPMRTRLAALREMMRSRLEDAVDGEPLTGREIEVLRLLQGSMSITEIAAKLYVSPNTVKTHTRSLYRKLGARSRTEAVQNARQRLLVNGALQGHADPP